ncbi:MAG: hypothetical protein NYU39_02470 [Aigarchaeota archaeon]|nr:hypothetical protein [Candidatus Caldarchaeales archaeon]
MSRAVVVPMGVGWAGLDDDGRLVLLRFFSEKVDELVRIVSSNDLPSGFVEAFLKELRERGYSVLGYWDERVGDVLNKYAASFGFSLERVEKRLVDVESLLPSSEVERFRELVREVSLAVARQRIMAEAGRRDLHIVHAVRVLDDLEKTKNQLYVRVREWYSVHFPELSSLLTDGDDFLKFASVPVLRHSLDERVVSKLLGADLARRVMEAAEKSVGGDMGPGDAAMLSATASLGLEVSKLAEKTAEYIRELMASEAPNLSAVAGPVLGSRLISLAGGLERLARLPASTIQVLGAEKALFRFLKTGRGSPKHGVIFQHPLIHTAPKWQRGKIARALATKISIAARIDYFSKGDRGAQLREALEKRVEEIRRKYASPPAKKPLAKPVERRRRRR